MTYRARFHPCPLNGAGIPARILKLFLSSLSDQQRDKFRQFLRSRYRVDPVVVSRLGYTTVGVELLTSMGDIFETPTGQNGFYALRSAVILAAMNPEGITPIALTLAGAEIDYLRL
ncbi:MAG: alpha/beta hydrolase [Xenococcaceae cyanobacterium MO_207.B15]|nr:alpha/beta hydrolase [Xenococcaceae cyanobacterium MO_207.B15]